LFSAAVIVLAVTISLVLAGQTKAGISFKEAVDSPLYGRLTLEYRSPATPEDLGMSFYPGAGLERSFVYSAKEKDGESAGYLAQAFFTTPDTADKVIAFYKGELGKELQIESPPKCRETLLFRSLGRDILTVRIICGSKTSDNQIELSRAGPTKAPHLLVPPRVLPFKILPLPRRVSGQ